MDKSKMMMVIIIALLVLLLGTVVGVGIHLLNQRNDPPSLREQQDPAIFPQPTIRDMRSVYFGGMTANLALPPGGWSDNVHFELVVGLNASDAVDADELEEIYDDLNSRQGMVRQIASDVLLARTYEQVRSLEGRDEVREAIKHALQDAFGSNLIVMVAFHEWVAIPDPRAPSPRR